MTFVCTETFFFSTSGTIIVAEYDRVILVSVASVYGRGRMTWRLLICRAGLSKKNEYIGTSKNRL